MGIAAVEFVVIVVVIARHLIRNLTADGFGIVATIIVQRTALVGALEIFHHSTANILAAFALVVIFQAPK